MNKLQEIEKLTDTFRGGGEEGLSPRLLISVSKYICFFHSINLADLGVAL